MKKIGLFWFVMFVYLFAESPVEMIKGSCIEEDIDSMVITIDGLEKSSYKKCACSGYSQQFSQTSTLYEGIVALQNGNYTTAFMIFQQLAQAGNFLAQQNLGVMYNNGLGISEDKEKAAYWFEQASKVSEQSEGEKVCRIIITQNDL